MWPEAKSSPVCVQPCALLHTHSHRGCSMQLYMLLLTAYKKRTRRCTRAQTPRRREDLMRPVETRLNCQSTLSLLTCGRQHQWLFFSQTGGKPVGLHQRSVERGLRSTGIRIENGSGGKSSGKNRPTSRKLCGRTLHFFAVHLHKHISEP